MRMLSQYVPSSSVMSVPEYKSSNSTYSSFSNVVFPSCCRLQVYVIAELMRVLIFAC
jgi:hypothetical protein